MGEYWGATVTPNYAPYPYGHRYFTNWNDDFQYEPTRPASEDNETTIEQIRVQIMGQHPEDISLLADTWQNAYDLLKNIKDQLLAQSNMLYDEAWKSSSAKDLFMKSGPGKTLAYLDEWMTAAENNRDALRGLVLVATESRQRMTDLWADYEREIEEAKNVDLGTKAWEWFWHYNLIGGSDQPEYDAAVDRHRRDQIEEVQRRYNQEAQNLAAEVASDYFEYLSASGYGAPFQPMNATMNLPGQGLWSMLPGGPPGGPPGAGPPPSGPPTFDRPPSLGLTAVPQLAQFVRGYVVPNAPGSQGDAPSVTPPPALPAGLPVAPPAPGLVAPPAVLPAPAVRQPPTSPGPLPRTGQPGVTPASLRNGVLQRPALATPPGAGQMPGANGLPPGARSPATPPVLNRPASNTPGGGPGKAPGAPGKAANPAIGRPQGPMSSPPPLGRPASHATRSGAARPGQPGNPMLARQQGPFASAPPGTSPPVLGKQPPKQRPGSRQELLGTPRSGNQRPGVTVPGGSRTTPPVLNAPQRPTEPKKPARTRRRQETPPPGQDWVGTQEARADAATPVLGAPAAPVTGAAVSKLEEVPTRLRNAARGPMPGQPRPATVAPELTARRTSREPVPEPAGRAEELDEQRIVTDEQAFTVQTPGGGVLTHQPESDGYRHEPPAALGGR